MGAPRGSHNARSYQLRVAEDVIEKIGRALSQLQRSRARFATVSSLAAYIEDDVGQTAGNLRRNAKYRALLESHLAKQKGGAGAVATRDNNIHTLIARLRIAQLEAKKEAAARERLEKFISNHLQALDVTAGGKPGDKNDRSPAVDMIDYKLAFEATALVLVRVLGRAKFLQLDSSEGVLFDRSARPTDRRIAGPSQLKWFVQWHEQTRSSLAR